MSARLRLTLSYAAFLVAAGLMVAVGIWIVFRTVPNYPLTAANPRDQSAVATRGEILDLIVKGSAIVLAALAAIGLGGGWLLAGWILRPLDDINEAARLAASGRLNHRIRLSGRSDEFKALADNFDHMLERLDERSPARSGSRPTRRTSCAPRSPSPPRCSTSPARRRTPSCCAGCRSRTPARSG